MVLVPDEMVTMEPAATGHHHGDGVARQQKGAARRDLDRPFPHAEIDTDRVRVEPRVTPGGVVIDGVDGSELGHRSLDEAGDRLLTADVAEQADGTPAGPADLLGH